MKIDYLDLYDSVVNKERQCLLNKIAVIVEVHTQLKNSLSKRESKRAIRNDPSIHATIIIIVMNVMVGNQIRASDVD